MKNLKQIIMCGLIGIGMTSTGWADYVNSYAVNIRDAASNESKIIDILHQGAQVTVVEELIGGWKKIQYYDGKTGIIHGKFLSSEYIAPVVYSKYNPQVNGSMYRVNVFRANLRSKANNEAYAKAILKQGDTLQVLDNNLYDNTWIKVRVVSSDKYTNVEGYISKKIIEVVPGFENVAIVEESAATTTAPNIDISNASTTPAADMTASPSTTDTTTTEETVTSDTTEVSETPTSSTQKTPKTPSATTPTTGSGASEEISDDELNKLLNF